MNKSEVILFLINDVNEQDDSYQDHPLHKILTDHGFNHVNSFQKGNMTKHVYENGRKNVKAFVNSNDHKWALIDKGGSRKPEKNPEGEGKQSLKTTLEHI